MVSILSVKVQARRMQLANSVDQAMFSFSDNMTGNCLINDVFSLDGNRGASGLY